MSAVHELPVPSYARGSGRITGVVRDAEGNGVAGVTIRATQHGKGGSRRKGDGAPGRDTLDETVRKAVERYHWRSQTNVEVPSRHTFQAKSRLSARSRGSTR